MKLFAMGVSAPALITTYSASQNTQTKPSLRPQESTSISRTQAGAWSDAKSTYELAGSFRGIQFVGKKYALFGGLFDQDSEIPTYLVQLGSFLDKSKAQKVSDLVNKRGTALRAFVYEYNSNDGSLFYRVFVAQGLSLKDAINIRDDIIDAGISDKPNIVNTKTLNKN